VLATLTGAMWAKVMWHAWWNWDPRQMSIVIALAFYGAYLILRGGVEDAEAVVRRLCHHRARRRALPLLRDAAGGGVLAPPAAGRQRRRQGGDERPHAAGASRECYRLH